MEYLPAQYYLFRSRCAGSHDQLSSDDLDGLLDALKKEGVDIDPHREDYDYGRFAWIVDPDGNRIELWEPPKNS
jgi:predicted enzyme related to lactoylglutathione lyase